MNFGQPMTDPFGRPIQGIPQQNLPDPFAPVQPHDPFSNAPPTSHPPAHSNHFSAPQPFDPFKPTPSRPPAPPRSRIVPRDPFPSTGNQPFPQPPPDNRFQPTAAPSRNPIVPRDPFAPQEAPNSALDVFASAPAQSAFGQPQHFAHDPNSPPNAHQTPPNNQRRESRPSNQLFIRNVPVELFSRNAIESHFAASMAHVVNVSLRGNTDSHSRRTALVRFASHHDAARALSDACYFQGRKLAITYYGSHQPTSADQGNDVPENDELVFTFVPSELFSDTAIKSLFNNISENGVRHVSIKERPFRDGTKRTAIISFIDVDHARTALQHLPLYKGQKLSVAYRQKQSHLQKEANLPPGARGNNSGFGGTNPNDPFGTHETDRRDPFAPSEQPMGAFEQDEDMISAEPTEESQTALQTTVDIPTGETDIARDDLSHTQDAAKSRERQRKLREIEELRKQIAEKEQQKLERDNAKQRNQREPQTKNVSRRSGSALKNSEVGPSKSTVQNPSEADPPSINREAASNWRGIEKTNIRNAKTLVGTCRRMCPTKEYEERLERDDVSQFEKTNGVFDRNKAVKKYRRSAAISEEPTPDDVRPRTTLLKTMNYLRSICDEDVEFSAIHHFVRDRTRSLRQDLTLQGIKDDICIQIHEESVRFHILSEHRLFGEDPAKFVSKQNLEQLDKCLISLREFYDLRREKYLPTSPNEAEMQAYYLMTQMSNLKTCVQVIHGFPSDIRKSIPVQFALRVMRASSSSTGNAATFFKCAREAPYLAACLMHSRFTQIRKHAMKIINQVNGNAAAQDTFEISFLTKMLEFEDHDETLSFCETLGFEIDGLNGPAADARVLTPSATFNEDHKNLWVQRRADNLIESKIQDQKISDIVAENNLKNLLSAASPRKTRQTSAPEALDGGKVMPSVLSRLGIRSSDLQTAEVSTPAAGKVVLSPKQSDEASPGKPSVTTFEVNQGEKSPNDPFTAKPLQTPFFPNTSINNPVPIEPTPLNPNVFTSHFNRKSNPTKDSPFQFGAPSTAENLPFGSSNLSDNTLKPFSQSFNFGVEKQQDVPRPSVATPTNTLSLNQFSELKTSSQSTAPVSIVPGTVPVPATTSPSQLRTQPETSVEPLPEVSEEIQEPVLTEEEQKVLEEREKLEKDISDCVNSLASAADEVGHFFVSCSKPRRSASMEKDFFANAEQLLHSLAEAAEAADELYDEAAKIDCKNNWVGTEASAATENSLKPALATANTRWIQLWCWLMYTELLLPNLEFKVLRRKASGSQIVGSASPMSLSTARRYERPSLFQEKVSPELLHSIDTHRRKQLKFLKSILYELLSKGISKCQLMIFGGNSQSKAGLRWVQNVICGRSAGEVGIVKQLTVTNGKSEHFLSVLNGSNSRGIPHTADMVFAAFDHSSEADKFHAFKRLLRVQLVNSTAARRNHDLAPPAVVVIQFMAGQQDTQQRLLTKKDLLALEQERLATSVDVVTVTGKDGDIQELCDISRAAVINRNSTKWVPRKVKNLFQLLEDAGTQAWMNVIVKARSFDDMGATSYEVIRSINEAWSEVASTLDRESQRWPPEMPGPRMKLNALAERIRKDLLLPSPQTLEVYTTTDYIKALIDQYGTPVRKMSTMVEAEHELVRFCRWLDDLLPLIVRENMGESAAVKVDLTVEARDTMLSRKFLQTQRIFLNMDRMSLHVKKRRGVKRDGDSSDEEEHDRLEKRLKKIAPASEMGTRPSGWTRDASLRALDALIAESNAYASLIAETIQVVSNAPRRMSA